MSNEQLIVFRDLKEILKKGELVFGPQNFLRIIFDLVHDITWDVVKN